MKADYNEQFRQLEDSFLKNRSEQNYLQVYNFIFDRLKRMITNHSNRYGLHFNSETIYDDATNGALWFMEQYNRDGWRVKKFTSYIVFSFRKALFNYRKKKSEIAERQFVEQLEDEQNESLAL